ncbi:MAG TPA: hypothetical protein VIO33_07875 [Burkholderiaceae bacterium]
MSTLSSAGRHGGPESEAARSYRAVLDCLGAAGVPVLIGGGYAYRCYTGIARVTNDLDLFIRRRDYEQLKRVLRAAGYRAEMTYPHWLAKVRLGGPVVDIIFGAGNGLAEVDDEWFHYAVGAEVLGLPAAIAPVEETIASKAFVMERERYDGGDVAHLLRYQSATMDWQRLLRRFGPHWRVLLAHLTLFGFIYPGERDRVPAWLMDELSEKLRHESHTPPPDTRLCAGTLLSREQFLDDIRHRGNVDARLAPHGRMSAAEIAIWTDAIGASKPKA